MSHTIESPRTVRFLVIGRTKATEFLPVVAFLQSLVAEDSQSQYSESLSVDSERMARRNFQPDMIVVLQSHPDEFDECDVQYLISEYPLSRLVCCYGTWCESIRRTRHAWPLACCVPIRNTICRIKQDLQAIHSQQNPLPLTASRTESFEYTAKENTES